MAYSPFQLPHDQRKIWEKITKITLKKKITKTSMLFAQKSKRIDTKDNIYNKDQNPASKKKTINIHTLNTKLKIKPLS